jgi:hypothetical protein
MMRIGNIVEFTQLNLVQSLVQPAVQGYTAQSKKSVSEKNTNELTTKQTKSK